MLIKSFILFLSLLNLRDFNTLRSNMVNSQIISRGITNVNVLNVMYEVPRHEFVPDNYKRNAYEDRPLPIGYGQTISQPYIVALMTELLDPKTNHKVLEIGTGSGYQAAILSKLVDKVYSVEIIYELKENAEKVINNLNYTNIFLTNSDGYYGWEEYAPYDSIIVTCAADYIPPPLIKQLKVGGVIVIPVGPPYTVQKLILAKKLANEKIQTQVITDVIFVPLVRKKTK